MIGKGDMRTILTEDDAREIIARGLADARLEGQRVLVIIPDSTRSGPMPLMFRLIHEALNGRVKALDFLIALGTHQPMTREAILKHLGVTEAEIAGIYGDVRVFNHEWMKPETFAQLGVITAEELAELSNDLLRMDVPVTINRMVLDYDRLVVCGPVFPHEVAGFSGGTKYFFPGIGGSEIIHVSHWLGAVITSYEIIGVKETPVRAMIDRAAAMIPTPTLLIAEVVQGDALHGLYVGEMRPTWEAAVDLSAQLNIIWMDRPYKQILSVMPEMYDDIWTAAKGMYKLEPVAADGGEVIIYAPHITEISYTHGAILDEIGYHVRDYFLKQWDKFKDYPWGVLAHSTHLKGMGTYENGVERPRVTVTLATGIPEERVRRVNLNYRDPATIDLTDFTNREDEGILLVPHAGEMLYRLKREA
ncbi:MAG TPA: DUF2088 domain-containing protein [Anaerolineae bacterium]|nr:DUF2088 domain-containing protein [Caldilineae bacterium]HID35104.1 DUF2088 domain-containing protein [Anaerolineae bacterium]HIQ11742.1 DUF2088 domain-containing protein [Caldilineales bacterium]